MNDKMTGEKAGELFNKARAAFAAASVRLLRFCGEERWAYPPSQVHYEGDAKPTVRGSTLIHNNATYEVLSVHRAKPGDAKGDPKLVCFRVVKSDTRDGCLFIFHGA